MKIYNMEQRSEEWFNIKKGKISASDAHVLFTLGKAKVLKSGIVYPSTLTAGASTLIDKLVAQVFQKTREETFISAAMERGILLEPIARNLYAETIGEEIEEVGFIENDLGEYGCSPDGVIKGKKRGAEIKVRNNALFSAFVTSGQLTPEEFSQVQFSMFVTKYDSWDLVQYNDNFNNPIHSVRVLPEREGDNSAFARFDRALAIMLPELKERVAKMAAHQGV